MPETNFHDDPGTRKAMIKKGTRYAEILIITPKPAGSTLLCVSGKGW